MLMLDKLKLKLLCLTKGHVKKVFYKSQCGVSYMMAPGQHFYYKCERCGKRWK